MKSIRSVSSAAGLGEDWSRVATCKGGNDLVTLASPCPHSPQVPQPAIHYTPTPLTMHKYLLVVSAYQAENVASVRYGQEVTEEEGQASVEAFS